jgi:CitB family two-component system response regulator MalR
MATQGKVLLIDHHQTDVFIFERLWKMTDLPHDLITLHSVQSAMEYISEPKNGNNIQTIFMELNLPVLNGTSFLENYDSLFANQKKKPRVVLMTGFMDNSVLVLKDQFRCISAVVEKPMSIEVIRELI